MDNKKQSCLALAHLFGIVFCLLVLLFVFRAPAGAEEKGQRPYWQPVAEAMQAGDYPEAYARVSALLNKHPGDALLLRIQGICLLETGYYDAAVAVLGDALEADPGSIACRYYLGQALACRGSIREAIAILEEMKSMAPDSEYVRLAAPALAELHNLADSEAILPDARRWYLYGSVASEYDDNVPLSPNNSGDDSVRDSWLLSYSLYGEYRFPDQKIDRSPVTLGLGYSLNGSDYFRSSFHGYDTFSQAISLFIDHAGLLLDRFYALRLEGQYNFTWMDGDQYSDVGAITGSFTWNWLDQLSSVASISWSNLQYEDDGEFPGEYSSDGDEYCFGLDNSLYLLDNRLVVGVRYQYRSRDAEGSQNDLHSNDVTGSLILALPWNLRLRTDLTYQEEDYPEYRDVSRLDDIWTWYTSLEYTFLDLFTLELRYTHATADSTVDYAEYRRNVAAVGLSASY